MRLPEATSAMRPWPRQSHDPTVWHEADLSTYFCNVLFRGAAMLAFATGMGAKRKQAQLPLAVVLRIA